MDIAPVPPYREEGVDRGGQCPSRSVISGVSAGLLSQPWWRAWRKQGSLRDMVISPMRRRCQGIRRVPLLAESEGLNIGKASNEVKPRIEKVEEQKATCAHVVGSAE